MDMPFGKHKGTPIEEIDDGYLTWLYEEADIRSDALRRAVEDELVDRGVLDEQDVAPRAEKAAPGKKVAEPSAVLRIAKEWHEALVQKFGDVPIVAEARRELLARLASIGIDQDAEEPGRAKFRTGGGPGAGGPDDDEDEERSELENDDPSF